jgi:hypothetical protein
VLLASLAWFRGVGWVVEDPQQSLDPWSLAPAQFPRRVDLELSAETYEALEELSRRTGRPIKDLVEDLLAQSISPPLPEPGSPEA